MPRTPGGRGLRRRPTTVKNRPVLDLDRITDAALTVLATEGVATLTVTAVAKELGVTVRAIYHYVTDRRELLVLTQRRAMELAPTPIQTGNWRADLSDYIEAAIDYVTRFRNLSDIALTEGIWQSSTRHYDNEETLLRILVDEGFSPRTAGMIVYEVLRWAMAAGMIGISPKRPLKSTESPLSSGLDYDALMDAFSDDPNRIPERHPLTTAAGNIGAHETFNFGLELLLNAIEALPRDGRGQG